MGGDGGEQCGGGEWEADGGQCDVSVGVLGAVGCDGTQQFWGFGDVYHSLRIMKRRQKERGGWRENPAEGATRGVAAALLGKYDASDLDSADALVAALPSVNKTQEALWTLLDVMFPGKLSTAPIPLAELAAFLETRLGEAWRLLFIEIRRALPYRWIGEAARVAGAKRPGVPDIHAETERILVKFWEKLPMVREWIVEDVEAAYEGDPAALTYAEVLLAYPGVLAIAAHRLAHELYMLDVPILPRVMSEWIHGRTGVDIHPGATIGHSFFMDHATGIVVGETTRIGDHVKIYQGVTLGALSFDVGADGNPIKHIRRHPTVEDHVVIYANATILGGETVIGAGSTIGANVFIQASVPPGSQVLNQHPGLLVRPKRGGGLV